MESEQQLSTKEKANLYSKNYHRIKYRTDEDYRAKKKAAVLACYYRKKAYLKSLEEPA